MKTSIRFLSSVAIVGTLSSVAVEPACTQAQAQSAVNAIENGVSEFVQYVNTFLPMVSAIWAMIGPQLGADVNAQFSKAVVAVEDSSAALQDAVRAAQAAQASPAPNYASLVGSVQDAVAKVLAIIHQYGGGSSDAGLTAPRLGAPLLAVDHQASVIAGWKL